MPKNPANASLSLCRKIGSKNTILLGLFLLTSTTYGIGLISYTKKPKTFLSINLVLRFFQGAGEVLLQITILTLFTTVFKDDMARYIGYTEIVIGLG